MEHILLCLTKKFLLISERQFMGLVDFSEDSKGGQIRNIP